MSHKELVFAFLSINGNAHMQMCKINSLVCYFTRSDLVHVELFFPDMRTAFSISASSSAHFKDPDYRLDEWEFISVTLPAKKYGDLIKRCAQRVGTTFDMVGMLSVPLGRLSAHFSDCNGSFCTKMVSSVMVASGNFPQDFDVFTVTPKSLRDYLLEKAQGCRVGTPYM